MGMFIRAFWLSVCLFVGIGFSHAAPPPGYYNSAEGLSGGTLKTALRDIVKGHTVIAYDSLYTPLRRLYEDPQNPDNIILEYSLTSVPKMSSWSREHVWPRSRGNSEAAGPDDSDLFHVVPCDTTVNTTRNSKYYDESDTADSSYRIPAHSLAPQTSSDSDSFQPPPSRKGDLARALFYLATRYDGSEINTSDLVLVSYPPTGPQMANLNTLLLWHVADPPDDAERRRNDLIYSDYQRNRNPFIDRPEWVHAIWGYGNPTGTGGTIVAQVNATSNAAVENPNAPGVFTVRLNQFAGAGGVTVTFSTSGTADANDFVLSGTGVTFNGATGSITIPPNSNVAKIFLYPVDDGMPEPAETCRVTLSPGSGYTIFGDSSSYGTVTITDQPVLPASWDFDSGKPFDSQANSGTGSLSLDGWKGGVEAYTGVSGLSLSLLNGAGNAGNGSWLDLTFSMTGYNDLWVSFHTRRSDTGFILGTWSYSINGGSFTMLSGVNTAPTTKDEWFFRIVDFTSITALDNAAQVTLRYTLSGATHALGNNRIDLLTLNATKINQGTVLPTVWLVAAGTSVAERSSGTVSLTFQSSTAAPSGGLLVHFHLNGTATTPGVAGADYALSGTASYNSATRVGTIRIPAGASSATLQLSALKDVDPTEFDETAAIGLQGNASYTVHSALNSAAITIRDDTPYLPDWAARFPGFEGALANPLADPDGDGIPSLAEFGFDTDPLKPDATNFPRIGTGYYVDPADGVVKQFATITLRRRSDAPWLTYITECASSFPASQWHATPVQVSSQAISAGVDQVTFRSPDPIGGSNCFLRVRLIWN